MEKAKKSLTEELAVVSMLVNENPCGMPKHVLQALRIGVKTLLGSHIGSGASREQVARYFHKDVRTISRWKTEYDDFPESRHDGHKEIEYDWIEIVRWKMKHSELWKEG